MCLVFDLLNRPALPNKRARTQRVSREGLQQPEPINTPSRADWRDKNAGMGPTKVVVFSRPCPCAQIAIVKASYFAFRKTSHLFPYALLLVFLITGCAPPAQSPNAPSFHDPVLRQKLTDMLVALHSDRAVAGSINELEAILAVNSTHFTPDQFEKLDSAKNKLISMRRNLQRFADEQTKPGYSPDKSNAEYVSLFSDAKRLIAEAAATL